MASGAIVGGGGEDGVVKERQRYADNKVYTRKAFKGPSKDAVKKVAPPAKGLVVFPVADGRPEEVALPAAGLEEEAELTKQPQPPPPPQPPPSLSAVVEVVPDETMAEGLPDAEDVPHETVVERLPLANDLPDKSVAKRPPVVNEVSDDTVVEREESAVPGTSGPLSGEGAVVNGSWDSKVKVNILSRSKQEIRDLRMKLRDDLDLVRNVTKKIKEKDMLVVGHGNARHLFNDMADNGSRMVHSEVGSVGITPRSNPSLNPLTVSVFENTHGVMDGNEKEKRTPKENQFYRNSDFLLAKDKFPPVESNKKSKRNGIKKGGDTKSGFGMGTRFFKSCSSLLEKLMKHQYGWVFKSPVDVKGLGLHDYFTIIKHPMDLGTIKTRLNANWYKSPREFAEDVRVTFHNAMTYNPEGQDVHVMAQVLLRMFEERWTIIESDYNREIRFGLEYETSLLTPTSRKMPSLPPPLDMRRVLDRSESMAVQTPRSVSVTPSGRTPAPKKPKAKDLNKREMTYDEKQKLSTNLQNLPSEKMDNIVQIIKKRNSQLFQHDDEIEVDIDTVDTETLWDLDRFVTNYKKSLSKYKRKAELAMQARAAAQQIIKEKEQAVVVVDAPTRANTGQKKVVPSPFPIQAEAPAPNSSRSSSSNSSGSDSGSSSSDSDTDSSSSSGSDDRQSPT
ncbi:hypothetical protein MLD38_029316 [Melastoma candidum]|uniref:Uncharacterized protein n=1 Tax=Melastoma candidum TaxID=119954 RepID=A0ACB9N3B4_9MYRT|nr:hypothetical protein MLD38_029316 [Melastoma candidum]